MPPELPTIDEADATGDIVALYDDVRATLESPVVNLIWRHLATFPGGLAWVWARIKPLYVSGYVGRAAPALRASVGIPAREAFTPADLERVGLEPAGVERIRAIVAVYNHTNALNLVALSGAQRDGSAGLEPPTLMNPVPAPTADMPRALSDADMNEPLAARVRALSAIGAEDPGTVTPTMYRHLGHWPAYLDLVHGALVPLDPALRRATVETRALAVALAVAAPALVEPPPIDPDVRARVVAVLEQFTVGIIARMVPIGLLLHRITPAPR